MFNILQATMKIIQLTYDTSYGMPDFGDADLVQLLTGWHPVVYITQPLFKDQEIVIKLLEELQLGNAPTVEFEPADAPTLSEPSKPERRRVTVQKTDNIDHHLTLPPGQEQNFDAKLPIKLISSCQKWCVIYECNFPT